jgi:hypothetical protein
MPREPSEITGSKTISIRLSDAQKEMYYDLGGHDWLRNYLNRQIRSEEIQLGLSPQNSLIKSPKKSGINE